MKTTVRDRRMHRNSWPIWRSMFVSDHMIVHSSLGESIYYLCPGCSILLPREFMRFCDCCGQRLNWGRIEDKLLKDEIEIE